MERIQKPKLLAPEEGGTERRAEKSIVKKKERKKTRGKSETIFFFKQKPLCDFFFTIGIITLNFEKKLQLGE